MKKSLLPLLLTGLLLALFSEEGKAKLALFFIYGAEVGLGELVVMFVLGLPLMRALPKTKFFPALQAKLDGTALDHKSIVPGI